MKQAEGNGIVPHHRQNLEQGMEPHPWFDIRDNHIAVFPLVEHVQFEKILICALSHYKERTNVATRRGIYCVYAPAKILFELRVL